FRLRCGCRRKVAGKGRPFPQRADAPREAGDMPPRRQRRPSESPALIAFGRQMRRMREAKGVKQETIAHITQVSGPQVSKIETGKKRATRSFVEIVDDRLEANGALINLWEDLNK